MLFVKKCMEIQAYNYMLKCLAFGTSVIFKLGWGNEFEFEFNFFFLGGGQNYSFAIFHLILPH